MGQNLHKYVTVAYELFTDNEKGIHELVEKAPVEHPFQFISGMGVALDTFEEEILKLAEGDKFDFVLPNAYGDYEEERVLELQKEIFTVNGKFDTEMIYPGAVVPLMNADGQRFHALVLEVKDATVIVDLNHPLAGKDLHFKGEVVTMREASNEEIQNFVNAMGGGCNCGGDCEGGCHGHGDGEGCCGGHGEGCCGGHGEGHGHGEGCCGGHGGGHGHGEGCCHNH